MQRFSRRSLSAAQLEGLLQPETDLERTLFGVSDFQKGLLWGEPRFGHPEGTVALHIREVLDNINRIPQLETADRARLRLIALAHDAFKYAEDRSRPRDWSKHHGVLARKFMESYTQDRAVLDVLETHDDAYYRWLAFTRGSALLTLDRLLDRIGHCLSIYYLFFKCDTQTGDKTQAPLRWFERQMPGIEPIVIRPYWPWERM